MVGLGGKDDKGVIYGAEKAIDMENRGLLFIFWKEGEEEQEVVLVTNDNIDESFEVIFSLQPLKFNDNEYSYDNVLISKDVTDENMYLINKQTGETLLKLN